MPNPSGTTLPIVIPRGFHGIVSTTFQGTSTKTAELTDSSGKIVSFRRNCGGEMCQTTVLVGNPDTAQIFQLELNGYSYDCGNSGDPTNNLRQVGEPVGGSDNGVSVTSYIFSRDGIPSTFDTVCITIIVQVGIDPSTASL